MPFLDSLDVANRALDHCGIEPILTVTEDSKKNQLCARVYDKVRRAEMRRNSWRFTIRNVALRPIDTTVMELVPPTYSASATYLRGAVVKDANGQLWLSKIFDNVNNTPGANGLDAWDMYFGPMSISKYDSTQTYFSGELVYIVNAGQPGGYSIFMSLQNSNADVPNVATAYAAGTTYTNDQTVSSGGSQWRCLLPFVTGVTPATIPLAFDVTATYSISQTATGSDSYIYSSVGSSNIGHDPTTDGGIHWTNTNVLAAWTNIPTIPVSSIKWLPLQATMISATPIYPVGSGPSSQLSTRNVFRLPAGFLKLAAQDPKAGSNPYLGSPTGLTYNDWNLAGNYLVSYQQAPLILRFNADVSLVSAMDDMFCEGLACRIATEVCEPLTQSGTKLQTIASAYQRFMGDARTVNAIEVGSEEPFEDDLITCRG